MNKIELQLNELKALKSINKKSDKLVEQFKSVEQLKDTYGNILVSVSYFNMFDNEGYSINRELKADGSCNDQLLYVCTNNKKENSNIEFEFGFNNWRYFLNYEINKNTKEFVKFECYKVKDDKKVNIKVNTFKNNLHKNIKNFVINELQDFFTESLKTLS